MLDFGQARLKLLQGKPVTRKGWRYKGRYILLQKSIKELQLPYFIMITSEGSCKIWDISQEDILAEDWVEVEFC